MKKLSTILLYTFIALSGVWVILLALGAFNVLNVASIAGTNFNYVIALILVIVGLLLYVGFMFVEKIRQIVIPAWFKCLFYVAFFVFTNVYYLFGLYHTIAGILVFDIYIAFLFNILGVSLFYNTQKDEKNVVKTTDKFLVFSTFAYAGVFEFVYMLIATLVKVIAKYNGVSAMLSVIVTELSVMILVGFIFAFVMVLSLKKEKRFVNACLIKYLKDNGYKTK